MTRVHLQTALVIADDIGVFLAIARSLGRIGVAVDVATSDFEHHGLSSRYIKRVLAVPGYLSHPEDWVEAIEALTRRHDYRLIFPTSDSSLMLLSRHSDRLGRVGLAIPNPTAFEVFSSKADTRRLADKLGVPVAQGFEVDPDTSGDALAQALGIPFVLKPSQPYRLADRQAKTFAQIVTSTDQAAAALSSYDGRQLVAERHFQGVGVGVSVLASEGEVDLWWQHRRLATVGETGRSSVRIGEPVSSVLTEYVQSMTRATALTGVAMFEFMHNVESDSFILLEVNPRFWGSLPLAVASGADFPARLWHMLFPPRQPLGHIEHIAGLLKADLSAEWHRMSDLERDSRAGWIASVRDLLALGARALITPARFDSWAPDDPRPYLSELVWLVRGISKAVGRRMAQKVSGLLS